MVPENIVRKAHTHTNTERIQQTVHLIYIYTLFTRDFHWWCFFSINANELLREPLSKWRLVTLVYNNVLFYFKHQYIDGDYVLITNLDNNVTRPTVFSKVI